MSNNPSTTEDDIVQDHPLLAYATINLFIHAEKAASSRPDVFKNEKDVLQQVISPWVRIYRILNQYSIESPADGTILLHMAAASDLVDAIEFVLERNNNVAIKDELGNTALHLAARRGHIIAGKILRERGADCDTGNRMRMTPLTEAASLGHLRFIEWLLHEGAMTERCAAGDALQAAALGEHADVVRMLLDAHADVNAQGSQYGNALPAAAYGGSTEIV
jgi:ankyrin repeat protein